MVAAKEPETDDGEPGRRILARAKSNIGPDEGGFAYRLTQTTMPGDDDIATSIAEWGERIDGSARDMLATADAAPEDEEESGAVLEAKDFLRDALANEPVPVKQLQVAARNAGHAWRTVKRAKQALGIVAKKLGMDAGWTWHFPEGGQKTRRGPSFEGLGPSQTDGTLRDDDREISL